MNSEAKKCPPSRRRKKETRDPEGKPTFDARGGNVRKVQKLSRHADLPTLTVYDDNRTDAQGEMTGLLSGLL